jgi:hypothetical protein
MKNKAENKKLKEAKETPVSDGDTRPDHQERAARLLNEKAKAEKNLTSERAADNNSLEDFKDAK